MGALEVVVLVALLLAALLAIGALFDSTRPYLNFAVVLIAIVLLCERIFGGE